MKEYDASDISVVMAMIDHAIASGATCPTNQDICNRLGRSSVSSASRIISVMERQGLIEVERYTVSRRIIIKATGQSTALKGNERPHSRLGPSLDGAKRKYTRRVFGGSAVEMPSHQTVSRDPCFWCGTRGDLPCTHNEVATA